MSSTSVSVSERGAESRTLPYAHVYCGVLLAQPFSLLLSHHNKWHCSFTTKYPLYTLRNPLETLYAFEKTQFSFSTHKTLNLTSFFFGVTNFMSELEHPNDEMSKGQEWSPGLGACEPIIMVMTAVPRV